MESGSTAETGRSAPGPKDEQSTAFSLRDLKMQQSTHNLGHRKHRQAFGKGNRNPRVNKMIAAELNKDTDEQAKQRERRKGKSYESVSSLFDSER
jgi:parvulin-like peptidyl-prolyl isomerase